MKKQQQKKSYITWKTQVRKKPIILFMFQAYVFSEPLFMYIIATCIGDAYLKIEKVYPHLDFYHTGQYQALR